MKIALKHLILTVALVAILVTLLGSVVSGYVMNKQNLIHNTLETNRVYAQKLASTTDLFFQMTLQTLEQSSMVLEPWMENPEDRAEELFAEAERLRLQTNTLNSITIAKADGTVVAASPQSLQMLGRILNSTGGMQALEQRRPLISNPYLSITGRLIIFISHPIYNKDGAYLGLVGGSLYLREENFLNDLLGDHFYSDGSYVYVVDSEGHLIYHVDPERIAEDVSANSVVRKLMNKESGAERVSNTKQEDMLAGYAYVPTSGWGIVSQRPTDAALQVNEQMMKKMIVMTIPALCLAIILIFFISYFIAKPLQKLALLTDSSIAGDQKEHFNKVRAWYYEAIQLKHALMNSLGYLHEKVDYITQESNTDPLTQLTNRRTMDKLIQHWYSEQTLFSLVLVDIDLFKRVNDTYGHAVGDQVLIYLAEMMKQVAGDQAVCCRFGGEEFVILIPGQNRRAAFTIAERLRLLVSEQSSPCGDVITISSGIADSYECRDAESLFELADQRLYEAKNSGRNRSNAGDKAGS